jgi:hypothetical protein
MRCAGLVVLLLAGCDGTRPRSTGNDDAFVSTEDAGMEMDAFVDPAVDAFIAPGTDAFVPGMDAWSGPDASWGTCSSGGVMGTCISTSSCTGMHVMGLCPGPSDIQCCLPITDAGPPVDAFRTGGVTPTQVLAALGSCTRIGGDYAKDVGGTANISICQTRNVIWWTADMDIDCDGGRGSVCMSDPDYMPDTSGVDSHGAALDASTLPFIVIPLASTRFRYADYGIRTGQVALVVYNGHMQFGIFGDAGPSSILGEASYAMAAALGIPNNPSTGGVDSGVTYLVFTDATARVAHNESNAEAVSIGQPLLDAFVP